jgi:hypothetical protein
MPLIFYCATARPDQDNIPHQFNQLFSIPGTDREAILDLKWQHYKRGNTIILEKTNLWIFAQPDTDLL